ncbi:hypothetical protein ABT052_19765 [Streptomyces sp. NPDC002766]|uniref:hypothetical protein n=1 Tax=unclassified Streptomyces TaxID=2593676 RepID=UPI00332954DA
MGGAAATSTFARLFLLPDVARCGGGQGPDRLDALTGPPRARRRTACRPRPSTAAARPPLPDLPTPSPTSPRTPPAVRPTPPPATPRSGPRPRPA